MYVIHLADNARHTPFLPADVLTESTVHSSNRLLTVQSTDFRVVLGINLVRDIMGKVDIVSTLVSSVFANCTIVSRSRLSLSR